MIAYGTIEEKWGLCLAGGGGKGAYEIGVWKALAEEDSIKFKAVSGASVGALNAVLFATMQVSEAENIWKKIKPDMLLRPQKQAVVELIKLFAYKNLSVKTLPIFRIPVEINIGENYFWEQKFIKRVINDGFFSQEGLKDIIESSGVLNKIGDSDIACYAVVCNMQKRCAEYYELNNMPKAEIRDVLLASSALPLVYGKIEMNGNNYRDGGLKDNVPIAPLYGCGCTKALVVHLDKPYKKGSARKQKYTIGSLGYQGMDVFHFYPTIDLKGLLGTLNFTPKNIDKLIKYGYEEMKAFIKEQKENYGKSYKFFDYE